MTLIDWAGVLGRGVLGITFLVAGMAKFASPQAAATAVAGFGAPAFARPLLRGLPHLEVAIAASLAFSVSAGFGAWAAAVLLVVFIAAMLVNLARGRRPPCNCFGQIRPAPIGAASVLRNVALLALAAWLVASGPPPAGADAWYWFRALTLPWRAVVAIVAIGAFAMLRGMLAGDTPEPAADSDAVEGARTPVRRSPAVRRPTPAAASVAASESSANPASTDTAPGRRLTGNGLPAGTGAPDFALPDLAGTTHTLAGLVARGKPVVLVFSSPGCESCQALVPKLPAQVTTYGDRLTLVLVSRDTVERNLAKLKEPGDLLVLRQQQYEVAEDYDITTSPAGIVVA
ncbi:MAG: MauE/DoxX family redox-associated membrane protein, partial [Vicinamibacterales bacterium]